MNVKKQARKDAYEYARAEMAIGEGAGNRRKLIKKTVVHRIMTEPGYERAFQTALDGQDYVEHAEAARKERRRKDVSKKLDRNVRGLATGNRESLTTGVMAVAGAIYILRQTGHDKVLIAEAKKQYNKAKSWVKVKKAAYKLKQSPS
jgi:hypothetical protein